MAVFIGALIAGARIGRYAGGGETSVHGAGVGGEGRQVGPPQLRHVAPDEGGVEAEGEDS